MVADNDISKYPTPPRFTWAGSLCPKCNRYLIPPSPWDAVTPPPMCQCKDDHTTWTEVKAKRRESSGWHPIETENDLGLLKWELDNCRKEIVRLRHALAQAEAELSVIRGVPSARSALGSD